jgi:hypothetical protein
MKLMHRQSLNVLLAINVSHLLACTPDSIDITMLDGRWTARAFELTSDDASNDDLKELRSDDAAGRSLVLEDGTGVVKDVWEDELGSIPTRCVTQHETEFVHAEDGWSVTEEDGEILEFSGDESFDCQRQADFGIWTSDGDAAELLDIEVVDDYLLVRSDSNVDGRIFAAVFRDEDS